MKTISKAILSIAGFLAATAGPFLACVINDANKKHRDSCDYLMVLGGNVIGEDTPSPQLLQRMKTAADYLKENTSCFVIPCGGCFRQGQKKSEAIIIAEYLIGQGIDENRIILEDKSTTTFENFEFALKIIEKHSGKNIYEVCTAFLSSDYHLFRASKIAKISGFDKIGKVSSPTYENMVKSCLREYTVAPELIKKAIQNKLFR